MSVTHYASTGRFNLLSDDKQTQVVLYTDVGNLSALFDNEEAENQYSSDMLPSEVCELLSGRIKSYIFMSDKAKKMDIAAAIMKNEDRLNAEWCTERAEKFERKAKEMRSIAQDALNRISDRESEGEQA